MEKQKLIAACKRQDRRAQQMLYEQFSPSMFGLLRRYMKNREDAEDVLIEAFFKVLPISISTAVRVRSADGYDGSSSTKP